MSDRRERRTFTEEFKKQVVGLYNAGKSRTEIIKEYENKIRELIDIDNPSRELLQALIDKVIIDKDRNVEIIYKFSILNN